MDGEATTSEPEQRQPALYNERIMDFLGDQLDKALTLRVPDSARQQDLASFNLHVGKGRRLLARHTTFDIRDFYSSEDARDTVETICGGLKAKIEEWGQAGAVQIEERIPREIVVEDDQSLRSLLHYILRDVQFDARGELAIKLGAIKTLYNKSMRVLRVVDKDALQLGVQLGEGKQGVVFKALWLSKEVAVHVPRDGEGDDLPIDMCANFFKEALMHAALNDSPHIVRLPAATLSGWMVLELADCDLHKLCHATEELPWATKVRLLREAAAGLDYVHSQNRVHGDVKSTRFLIFGADPETCHLKISDIRLCCEARERKPLTLQPRGVTPLWVAPELYQGKRISRKSDVYSFGVVCYELVTQMQPFGRSATSQLAIMAKKLRGEEPCSLEPDSCPPEMVALMRRCCDVNPGARPTMDEVYSILLNLPEEWVPLEDQEQLQSRRALYNSHIMDFLDAQLQQVRNLEAPPTATERALVNFNLQIGRGDRLLEKHAVLFDVKDFYMTEVARDAVEKICECLKETLEEWGLPVAACIKTIIPPSDVEEDKQQLQRFLNYLLKDDKCDIEDKMLQHWSAYKEHHAQNMKVMQVIDEAELVMGNEMGRGGQGVVFRAHLGSTPVAVKKRHRGQQVDVPVEEYAEFLREALAHAALDDHEHIIRLLATTSSGSLVMELADSDLDKLCRAECSLPWELKARLLQQGSDGLQHIHSKNRVHGDVKPRNFLICGTCPEDYCLKISDFGLAFEEAQSRRHSVRLGQGTPRWIAPEAYEDRPITQMSDVFSFGVVCYYVISQKYPYGGLRADDAAVMGSKLRGEEPCSIQVPKDCPQEALELLKMCCALDPMERPTMKVVDKCLKHLLEQCGPAEDQV